MRRRATVKTNTRMTPSRNGAEPTSRSTISNGKGRSDNIAGCNNFLPILFDILIPDAPSPCGALARRPAFPFVSIALLERPLLPYFFWLCVCVIERHVHDQHPCPIEPTLDRIGLHIGAIPIPEVCGQRGVRYGGGGRPRLPPQQVPCLTHAFCTSSPMVSCCHPPWLI